MTQIRKRYWIPKLRSLAKQQIKTCCGCRRFQATAVVKPPPGIVHELYEGKDGLVRAVKLRAGKSFMERPVQHLYPLELSCDIGNRQTTKTTTELNAEATEVRPKRDAAVAARLRNQMIVDD
jgi:hypothetical protein